MLPLLLPFPPSASSIRSHSLSLSMYNKFLCKWRTIKWKGKQIYDLICTESSYVRLWISNAIFILCDMLQWSMYDSIVSVYLFMVIDLENKWVNWSRLSPSTNDIAEKKRLENESRIQLWDNAWHANQIEISTTAHTSKLGGHTAQCTHTELLSNEITFSFKQKNLSHTSKF